MPLTDRLRAILAGVAEEKALGMSDLPVDREEVQNLFSLLANIE